MDDDDRDYTDKYNTQLTGEEAQKFSSWAATQAQLTGRDVTKDLYDYDLKGWWQKNQDVNLSGAHLVDTYKKPNHPTFSNQSQYHGVDGNQGGQWVDAGDGRWQFVAGSTNRGMYSAEEMGDYFNRVEKGNSFVYGGQ